MTVKLTKVEMPETSLDWGIVQINNLIHTYYRFDMKNGKPVLDTTYFADQIEDTKKKHRNLPKGSKMYKAIQNALSNYIKDN